MKRALIIVGAIVVVLVLAVAGVFVSAFAGLRPIEGGAVLRPGVTVVKDGFVSCFLVDLGGGRVALVDACNDVGASQLLEALRARGLTRDAVQAIFLTHGHADHTHGARAFPHADVYALAADVALVEGRVGAASPMGRLVPARRSGVTVNHPLGDGASIVLGDTTIRVFALPGHTRGSAAFLARGVLFLGDSASATKEGEVRHAVWAFSENIAQNEASLRALAARLRPEAESVQVLAFAHSGPLAGFAPLERFAARP